MIKKQNSFLSMSMRSLYEYEYMYTSGQKTGIMFFGLKTMFISLVFYLQLLKGLDLD